MISWPNVAVLLVMFAAVGIVVVRRGRLLVRLVRAARPVDRTRDTGARVEREIVQVLGQRKLFQKPLAGLMHACIFWGFIVITIGTVDLLVDGILGFHVPGTGSAIFA